MLAAQWSGCVETRSAVWVEQWRAWLPELAARYAHVRLLSRAQRRALWEQIVAERSAPAGVLNLSAIAAWASDAWSILRRYAIDDATAYGDSADLRKLLAWGAAYENRLAERDWADPEGILVWLCSEVAQASLAIRPRELVLLDLDELPPLEMRCLQALERAGWSVSRRQLPALEGRVSVHAADSPAAEIEQALSWLRDRLGEDPEQRVALVAEHDGVLDAIVRRRSDEWPEVAFARGTSPLEMPAVAAALNALEMLGPEGDSLHLSGWLRSPFMQGLEPDQAGAAARFELARRETLIAQLPLRRTRHSLLQSLHVGAPRAGERLSRAVERGELTGNVAPLADHASAWRDQLEALQWLRGVPQSVREPALTALEQAFDSVAALGSMLGAVSSARALEELRQVLSERLLGSPLPLRGLHVLERIDDVGPGYAAIRVTGMSQVRWPPRPRHNPLLPRRLMRELRIPWGSREDCFERASAAVHRVAAAAADVAFSFSPSDDEEHAQPSAMLRPWLGERAAQLQTVPAAGGDDAIVAGVDGTEIIPDRVRQYRRRRLRGGAALLDTQASCPLRAFIDYRLHVRAPQRWQRGIPPALRGRILHRAAAGLLRPGIGSAQLAADSGVDWEAAIAAAAEHALREELGDARAWFGSLAALEQARVREALSQLLETERRRSAFTVQAVETGIRFDVETFEISARLDRLDRLDSGSLAVIDYKTGRMSATPHWFDERGGDYQLPLYVVAVGESVTAMALCSLGPDAAGYRGYWPEAGTFPAAAVRRDDTRDWTDELDRWRNEIAALVREFVAGDTAICDDARSQVAGMYAPLSRVTEADAALRTRPA